MNLYDLIIYDLHDGDTLDRFSMEHLTRCEIIGDRLHVESTQRSRPYSFHLASCGYYKAAR